MPQHRPRSKSFVQRMIETRYQPTPNTATNDDETTTNEETETHGSNLVVVTVAIISTGPVYTRVRFIVSPK